jgi:hypothetical protein
MLKWKIVTEYSWEIPRNAGGIYSVVYVGSAESVGGIAWVVVNVVTKPLKSLVRILKEWFLIL